MIDMWRDGEIKDEAELVGELKQMLSCIPESEFIETILEIADAYRAVLAEPCVNNIVRKVETRKPGVLTPERMKRWSDRFVPLWDAYWIGDMSKKDYLLEVKRMRAEFMKEEGITSEQL